MHLITLSQNIKNNLQFLTSYERKSFFLASCKIGYVASLLSPLGELQSHDVVLLLQYLTKHYSVLPYFNDPFGSTVPR